MKSLEFYAVFLFTMQEEHPVLTGPQIVLFMIFVYENIVLVVLLEKKFLLNLKNFQRQPL